MNKIDIIFSLIIMFFTGAVIGFVTGASVNDIKWCSDLVNRGFAYYTIDPIKGGKGILTYKATNWNQIVEGGYKENTDAN